MKKKDKYSIAPELNILKPNETTTFDSTKFKYSVISSTIQRIQSDNGSKFRIKKVNTVIEVTRVN